MKALLLCCGMLLCPAVGAQLQVSSVALEILNGHSGKPVKRANLILTQTPVQPYATPLDRKTDSAGRSSLLVQSGVDLHAVVQRYPTCRTVSRADRKKLSTGYATEEILARGIVSANACSKRTVSPTPGQLVLFVRPQHWWERMSY